MQTLPIVIAILLTTLPCCVNSAVGNGDVSNYFSSYVPRDHRNPIFDSIPIGDLENYKNAKEDCIVEGIKNEILPQFSNLNLSQPLKSVLLKDYYLTKPYTKGDVSNLYNLDLLGTGFVNSNTKQKSNLWQSRPNYNWLNRNITSPFLWHQQFPRSDSSSNLNSSSYNLCNNHMSHPKLKEKDSVITKPSLGLIKSIDLESGKIKIINNEPLELKELLNTNSNDFSGHIENKFDIAALKLENNTALDDDSINQVKNLTLSIVQHLPSLSDIYVHQSENDLTKLFNSFNTSSLLNKYENSQRTFR